MTPSIFPNATNTHFHGGNHNFVAGNVIYTEGIVEPHTAGLYGQKGFDYLRDHCTLDALVDSNERFDPPRCAEETRELMIRQIHSWIDNGDPLASMLWLFGSAGAGKSALAQTIAEQLKEQGRLLASFFFSRTATSSDRSNGNRLIPTLVYQLAQGYPETRWHIESYIEKDPAVFSRRRHLQMEHLFLQPLNAFSFRKVLRTLAAYFYGPPQSQLIVIDGLDECHDPEVQSDILAIIASAVSDLKLPFRFLIASRPESHIRHTFNKASPLQRISVRRIDLDKDPEAVAAIRKFVLQEFHKIKTTHPVGPNLPTHWPPESAIRDIVLMSSTQFIYPSTVMRYVQSHKHRPDDRLDVILRRMSSRLTQGRPLDQLDLLYDFIFSHVPEENRDLVWRILGILYVTAKTQAVPLPIPSAKRLENILQLRSGDVELLLDPLSSVISSPADRNNRIVVLHASLEYLLDPTRSGNFALNLSYAHESLAAFFYSNYEAGLFSKALLLSDGVVYEPCLRFLYHAAKAYLSEPLLHQLLNLPFADIIGRPAKFKSVVWVCLMTDRLFNVFLRPDFMNGQEFLCRHLDQIYHHLAILLNQKPIPIADMGHFLSFKRNSHILNLADRLFYILFKLQASRHGVKQRSPSRYNGLMFHILLHRPRTRFMKHIYTLLLPVADEQKGTSSVIIEMHGRAKYLQQDPITRSPHLDAELEADCHRAVNDFLNSHSKVIEPQRLRQLKATWQDTTWEKPVDDVVDPLCPPLVADGRNIQAGKEPRVIVRS